MPGWPELGAEGASRGTAQVTDQHAGGAGVRQAVSACRPERRADGAVVAPTARGAVGLPLSHEVPGDVVAAGRRQLYPALESSRRVGAYGAGRAPVELCGCPIGGTDRRSVRPGETQEGAEGDQKCSEQSQGPDARAGPE